MSLFVITIIGPDRPGLVESVADIVSRHQGNWMASRMAHLGGKFAGIVQISVPDGGVDGLLDDLRTLSSHGLSVQAEADAAETSPFETLEITLELVGGDRPGIVKEISHVLAERHVNVEELNTEYVSAPMTGKDLFRATAHLRLPAGLNVDDLRRQLEAVAHDLMVDIALK